MAGFFLAQQQGIDQEISVQDNREQSKVVLTLPQLSPLPQMGHEENTLESMMPLFIRTHAYHLRDLYKGCKEKRQIDRYCALVVEKYPMF